MSGTPGGGGGDRPAPSTVRCSAPTHALTDAQGVHHNVLLVADRATAIEVPRDAAPGSAWLIDVATDGAVTVSVAGDAGSINGAARGSAAAAGAGSALTVWVRSNPGNAPAVRVGGDLAGGEKITNGKLVGETDRDGDHAFTAADAGEETLFDGATNVTYTLPAGLPRGWRHTVWNRSAAATVRVRGAAGVRVNGTNRGAVTLGPGALAHIAGHGSDVISVAALALTVATPGGGDGGAGGEEPSRTPGDFDPAHRLNQGLALMIGSHPEGSRLLGVELVSRAALAPIGTRVAYNGDSVFGGGLRCARLPAARGTRDGLCLADAAALAKLKAALEDKTAWSVHLRFFISAAPPPFGHILAWPAGAATQDFVWEPLQRNGSADDSWRHLFIYQATRSAVRISRSPAFTAGEWAVEWSLGVVRDGDTLQWYRDGAAWGESIAGLGAATMQFPGTPRPFCFMNWSDSDPYAHSWEWRLSQVRIWSRALSGQEMADAHTNVGVFA